MSLINYEINLILTWSANCFKMESLVQNQVPTLKLVTFSCNFMNLR